MLATGGHSQMCLLCVVSSGFSSCPGSTLQSVQHTVKCTQLQSFFMYLYTEQDSTQNSAVHRHSTVHMSTEHWTVGIQRRWLQ